MTRFFTSVFLVFILFQVTAFAQNTCGVGSDEPQFACFTCGSGYVGSTAGYSADNASYNFPCGTIENSQWIAFEANSTTIQANIISGNCQNGNGVEAAIYTRQLQRISNCYSSGGTNMSGTLTATGLIPGEQYLIMIDGFGGDVCDISVSLTGNRVYDLPLPPGQIVRSGPADLCPGIINTYEIAAVGGATDYFWSVPQAGKIVGGQGTQKIFVEWQTVGGGVVRVTPSNQCYTGLSSFQTELVMPLSPTVNSPEFVCPNQFPITRDGNDFPDFGTYPITLTTASGCDSMVTYNFLPKISTPIVVNQTICPGQCVQVGDSCYTTIGTQIITLDTPQANGCDSLISLTINLLDSVSINNFPDTLFCIDTCTAIIPDIVFTGQNLVAEWTTTSGNIAQTSGLSVTVCTGGDYNLRLRDTLTGLFCDLKTNVTGDTISLDVLQQIDVTGGPCASDTVTLTTDLLATAIGYDWQLPPNATVVGSALGNSIRVVFDSAFTGDICVEAFNTCKTSNVVCANVTVSSAPSSNFDAPASVCVSENASIQYTGGASASAIYDWDFGGGIIVNNSGSTNYEINFPSSGNYDIILQVSENGCTSLTTTKTISVELPLNAPNISCIADSESIIFSWANDPLAASYSAVSIAGQAGNLNGTEYTVTGLSLGDSVTLEVGAIRQGVCPPTISTLRCGTQDCPNLSLNIVSANYCENELAPSPLMASASGGSGLGTFVWSGQNVSLDGDVDLSAGTGTYTAEVTYTENGCDFTASSSFDILESPALSANVQSSVWIPGTTGDIDLSVSSSSSFNVNWSNGSTDEDLIGVPAGNYSVNVTDANGCQSDENYTLTAGSYFVQPIQIICEGTSTTLFVSPSSGATFDWTPATGLDCVDCPNPVASPSQSTTYTVTATLPNGQSGSTTVEVIVVPFSVCPTSREIQNTSDIELNTLPETISILNEEELSISQKEALILDNLRVNKIEVFPNPTSGELNIISADEIRNIEVFDVSGKEIKIFENTSQVDISVLPKGVYLLKITSEKQTVVERIFKN